MRKRARRGAIAIGIGALAGVALGAAAGSTSLRASLSAACRAFQDPSLVEASGAGARAGAPPPAEVDPAACAGAPAGEDPEVLQAWITRDFEPAADEDLEDPEGATIASLVLPDLRVPLTRRTMRFVRYFARTEEGRALFLQRYRRAAAYREFIEHEMREAGVPEELLWVAAIESSFDPRATSRAGAAGLWQFMPRTGETYGLYQSEWVDERRSLVKSTTAAVSHLRDLYERFGRWDLALSAYNLGHERVLEGMERVLAARDPDDRGPIGVAELAQAGVIPSETANYVPQIMAFALIAANRARFGLDQSDLDAARPMQLGEIAVPAGTRLRTIARAAGISTAQLREYNPQLLRDRAPPTGGDYLVTLPADRVARTLATFPAYLDHEVLAGGEPDEPEATAELASAGWATGMAGTGASASSGRGPELEPSAGGDDDPLPPRPAVLGRNRLPAFMPPGQLPVAMPVIGDPLALQTRLPVVLVGGGVGWQRGVLQDPLGIMSGRPLPSARVKGREAALAKQLAFLDHLGEERVQRLGLPGGIAAEIRRDPSAPLVSVSVSVAGAEEGAKGKGGDRGPAPTAVGETRYTITVPPRDLDVAVALAAGRLRLLLGEASHDRVADLRRRAGAAQRDALEKAPYGRAWVALGEALFPAGHPLEGRVIGAADDPEVARDLRIAESLHLERRTGGAVISISGDVTRAQAEAALARALGPLPRDAEAALGPHPREERILLEDAVPGPRLLYGWIAPGEGEPGEAALRVATEILVNPRVARLAKALVTESGLAAEVKGRLDLGPRASVVALDIAPAAGRESSEIDRRLDAELSALASTGPTWNELSLAKVLLMHQLDREIARIQGKSPAAAAAPVVTSARLREALQPGSLERLRREVEDVSPAAVRGAIRRIFDRRHRVVVTTWPRGAAAVAAAGGAARASTLASP